MNTTRLFALVALVALALAFTPFANAASPDSISYTVTLLKYEPTPTQPGDIVEAWIQITNTGSVASPSVTLLVDAAYPFTPVSAQDASITVGSIASRSTYVTRVKLAVDSTASDGTFTVPVRLTDNGVDFRTTELSMQVRSSNAVLVVDSVKTAPEELVPGTTSALIITVSNTQASTLRDVSVSLDLADTTLSTVGTTSKQSLSRIEGGSDATYRFDLLAEPEAQSGIARVPITFTFVNAEGETVTQTESAGIVIHAKPEVSVLVDRVTASADGKSTQVLVRVINKGLSQIKFAELAIADGDTYDLADSRSVSYVGNIDSDDFQTAEYSISSSASAYTLSGTLTYRDALNKEYSMPVQLAVTAPAKTGSGGPSPLLWIVIIVVVVVGIVVWRRRTKSKR